jgi:hypothetical protein
MIGLFTRAQPCGDCVHFCTDPRAIERAVAGLAILSSADAAVRGRDGLCLYHDRLTNGRQRCDAYGAPAVRPIYPPE